MQIIKTILKIIFEPIRFVAGKENLDKLVFRFHKHPIIPIIVSVIITLIIVFIVYIYPNI